MKRLSLALAVGLALLGPGATAARAQESPLAQGIALYDQGDFAGAEERFAAAHEAERGDAVAILWLGLARLADERFNDAIHTWSDLDFNPRWRNAYIQLTKLAYWRAGKDAGSWFGFCIAGKPHYRECRSGKAAYDAGDDPPPFDQWPDLAGIRSAAAKRLGGAAAAAAAAPPLAPADAAMPAEPATPPDAAMRRETAAPPQPVDPGPPDAAGAPSGGDAYIREWPAFGAYAVGDAVLYRAAGPLHYPARIRKVGAQPGPGADFSAGLYLVEDEHGSTEWVDRHAVSGRRREPFWTGFFTGDWNVNVPVATNVVTDGYDAYRVVSGGMRLPPLRINGDGTYDWRVEENGKERVIHGRWVPREDAPGLVLLHGDQGADWTVHDATDQSALEVRAKEVIQLTADCCTYQEATRPAPGAAH